MEADSPTLIKTYEGQVKKLETRKVELADRLAEYGQVEEDFESSFQTAFDFLGNPHKLWLSEDITDKKLTLKLVFAKQLPYRRNERFQTAAYSLPFRLTAGLKAGYSGLVEPWGVEPQTSCMPCKRSTN